jgi:metallo-beta-lactamase family protein
MKLKFLGAAGMVTGSSYLIESGGEKILIDCGLIQGEAYCDRRNFEPFAYDPKEIKAVFVTHSHIDHSGLLPKLVKAGYNGPIYSTPPTRDCAYELLLDSEDILKREAEKSGLPPLYLAPDVEATMKLWQGIVYGQIITTAGFKVHFQNAGHILGSSSAVIEAEGKKLVISGDLGNINPPLIRERDLIPADSDYCLIESSYGDREHEDFSERREILEDVIEDTTQKKGVLMIPVFAMERMQELLYEISELMDQGRVPREEIFIDSPLAIKLTKIYDHYTDYLNSEVQKFMWKGRRELLNFPGTNLTLTHEESKAINNAPAPKIIIAGSGMSNGGRILYHELLYLPDPKNTILVVGYQADGTLGRKIINGVKEVEIMGQKIAVRARVVMVSGYSAHADQASLLAWLSPAKDRLKKVFTVHGDQGPASVLAGKIRDDFAVDAEVPRIGEEVVL